MKVKKIKIAFDLDGVIVDKPPLVPRKWLERLFKGGGSSLHFRFPDSSLEQFIRKTSHFYLFRPPINKNIDFIKKIAKSGNYELYIVSARYSFLEKETETWLNKRNIKGLFKEIYLNRENKQPHLFKENALKKIRPDYFIDDDETIVNYLRQKLKNIRVYCFTPKDIAIKNTDNLFLNKLDLLF